MSGFVCVCVCVCLYALRCVNTGTSGFSPTAVSQGAAFSLAVELQCVQCIFVVLLQSEREREREIKMYNDF